LNFPSTNFFQKVQLQIGIAVVCPKSQNSIYGTQTMFCLSPFIEFTTQKGGTIVQGQG
jgi:hypothetical protein